MPKRTAGSELNADNWDSEEPSDDRGEFEKAANEVIGTRKIITAKRRTAENQNSAPSGLFKSFTGFSSFNASSTTFKLNSAPTDSQQQSAAGPSTVPVAAAGPSTIPVAAPPGPTKSAKSNKHHYMSQLKALNKSVLSWITSHVAQNPHCILTPIFKDYEQHLADIEQRYPLGDEMDAEDDQQESRSEDEVSVKWGKPSSAAATTNGIQEKKSDVTGSTPGKLSLFSFGQKSASNSNLEGQGSATADSVKLPTSSLKTQSDVSFTAQRIEEKSESSSTAQTVPGPAFSFKSSIDSATGAPGAAAGLPTFMFGIKKAETTPAGTGFTGFGLFGSASSASGAAGTSLFATASKSQPAEEEAAADDDEEYVPPKPEVREIKEEGSIHSVRCKLFYKIGEQWKERGLGNLHIKPLGSGKLQLLIRADTNLGPILLNISMPREMPVKQQGNNVTILCVPSPPLPASGSSSKSTAGDADTPAGAKPVPFLIRVKSEDTAQQLVDVINNQRRLSDD